MQIAGMLLISVVFMILIYAVILYNHLIVIKHNVGKAWSNIDVLLTQRYDELPKLVEVCKAYMQHERGTLEAVMQARSRVSLAQQHHDIEALGVAEDFLRQGLGRLFIQVEDYPELKADKQFLHLQQRISGLENAIADRREFYNESVTRNNTRIEQFPDVFLARLFAFKPFKLLKFKPEQTGDVDIKSLLDNPANTN